MRWCKYCNCSLGEQEAAAVVGGEILHGRCEASYRKEISDKIARSQRHRFLYLPSLKGAEDDEPSDCF